MLRMSDDSEVADVVKELTVRMWFINNFESYVEDFDYDFLLSLSKVIDTAILAKKKELN